MRNRNRCYVASCFGVEIYLFICILKTKYFSLKFVSCGSHFKPKKWLALLHIVCIWRGIFCIFCLCVHFYCIKITTFYIVDQMQGISVFWPGPMQWKWVWPLVSVEQAILILPCRHFWAILLKYAVGLTTRVSFCTIYWFQKQQSFSFSSKGRNTTLFAVKFMKNFDIVFDIKY